MSQEKAKEALQSSSSNFSRTSNPPAASPQYTLPVSILPSKNNETHLEHKTSEVTHEDHAVYQAGLDIHSRNFINSIILEADACRRTNFKKSLELYKKAEQCYLQFGNDTEDPEIIRKIASVAGWMGNIKEKMHLLQKAFTIISVLLQNCQILEKELKYQETKLKIANSMAMVRCEKGDFYRAFSSFKESFDILNTLVSIQRAIDGNRSGQNKNAKHPWFIFELSSMAGVVTHVNPNEGKRLTLICFYLLKEIDARFFECNVYNREILADVEKILEDELNKITGISLTSSTPRSRSSVPIVANGLNQAQLIKFEQFTQDSIEISFVDIISGITDENKNKVRNYMPSLILETLCNLAESRYFSSDLLNVQNIYRAAINYYYYISADPKHKYWPDNIKLIFYTFSCYIDTYRIQERIADAKLIMVEFSRFREDFKKKVETNPDYPIAYARHPHTALYNTVEASIFKSDCNIEKTQKKLESALNIYLMNFGKSHYQIADVYNSLGNLAYKFQRVEDAYVYYKDACHINKETFGENHPLVAINLIHIGDCLIHFGKFDEAKKTFEEALDILNHNISDDKTDKNSIIYLKIHRAKLSLGNIMIKLGLITDGKKLHEEAMTGAKEFYKDMKGAFLSEYTLALAQSCHLCNQSNNAFIYYIESLIYLLNEYERLKLNDSERSNNEKYNSKLYIIRKEAVNIILPCIEFLWQHFTSNMIIIINDSSCHDNAKKYLSMLLEKIEIVQKIHPSMLKILTKININPLINKLKEGITKGEIGNDLQRELIRVLASYLQEMKKQHDGVYKLISTALKMRIEWILNNFTSPSSIHSKLKTLTGTTSYVEYAMMSAVSYEYQPIKERTYDDEKNKIYSDLLIQKGWKVVDFYKDPTRDDKDRPYAFYAIAFEHEDRKEIVIAYKGTNPKSFKDLIYQDIIVMGLFEAISEYNQLSYDFSRKVIAEYGPRGYLISHTGHSLGGYLAEIRTWEDTNEYQNYGDTARCPYKHKPYAVTIDSPGSLEVIKRVERKSRDTILTIAQNIQLEITCILSVPNIVNTSFGHLGKAITYEDNTPAESVSNPTVSPAPVFPKSEKSGYFEKIQELISKFIVNPVRAAGTSFYSKFSKLDVEFFLGKSVKDFLDCLKLIEGHGKHGFINLFDPETELVKRTIQLKLVTLWPKGRVEMWRARSHIVSKNAPTSEYILQKSVHFDITKPYDSMVANKEIDNINEKLFLFLSQYYDHLSSHKPMNEFCNEILEKLNPLQHELLNNFYIVGHNLVIMGICSAAQFIKHFTVYLNNNSLRLSFHGMEQRSMVWRKPSFLSVTAAIGAYSLFSHVKDMPQLTSQITESQFLRIARHLVSGCTKHLNFHSHLDTYENKKLADILKETLNSVQQKIQPTTTTSSIIIVFTLPVSNDFNDSIGENTDFVLCMLIKNKSDPIKILIIDFHTEQNSSQFQNCFFDFKKQISDFFRIDEVNIYHTGKHRSSVPSSSCIFWGLESLKVIIEQYERRGEHLPALTLDALNRELTLRVLDEQINEKSQELLKLLDAQPRLVANK